MALSHTIVRSLARLSQGWRVVSQYGAGSAQFLEYACRNQPEGRSAVGRLCDRALLRADECGASRRRVATVRAILVDLVTQRRAAGAPTLILDVAAGSARYLRELVAAHGAADLSIVCCDRDPRQVEYGRGLAATEGLHGMAFWVGDATDVSSYLTSHDPDIVVAVDIFPYLESDDAVHTVLRLAFDRLSPGGTLVCSTQTGRRSVWWASNRSVARVGPIDRPADVLANWLRATGFAAVDERRCDATDQVLVARKPDGTPTPASADTSAATTA
jgi:SAM-dependent methyltransferase